MRNISYQVAPALDDCERLLCKACSTVGPQQMTTVGWQRSNWSGVAKIESRTMGEGEDEQGVIKQLVKKRDNHSPVPNTNKASGFGCGCVSLTQENSKESQ